MDTPALTITTPVTCAAVSSDTAVVGNEPNDTGIHTFDLGSGQPLQTLTGVGNGGIRFVAISPNGQLAVATTDVLKAALWDVNTGRLINTAPGPAVVSDNNGRLGFSPDGQAIFSSFFGDLTVFDTALGQKSTFRVHLAGATLFGMASSPEGRFLAAGYVRFDSGNDVVVYDLVSEKPSLQFLTNKGFGVTCLAWTGGNIITGSGNGTIKLWDAQSGAAVSRTFPSHVRAVKSLAVSSDGRLALSGGDDSTMKVMEIASGRELHSFSHADGQIVAVGFVGSSKAVSCASRTLKVWDLTGL